MKWKVLSVMFAAVTAGAARGATVTVEPDNYADGTVLTNAAPGITLNVANGSNVSSNFFKVTANTVPAGGSSTGTKTFGDSNVAFWNGVDRLRMDFGGVVGGV